MIDLKELIRKLKYNQKRIKELEKYNKKGNLDTIRQNELAFLAKETANIQKAVENKQINIGNEGLILLESSLNSIAKIRGTESVKPAAEKQAVTEAQEANIISKTKVEEIMRTYNISKEFAEKIIANPKKAQEEAEANFKKMQEETAKRIEKEKTVKIKKARGRK